jgi:decaprenylphospho-beta-D-ribofuranose 2-oxidase
VDSESDANLRAQKFLLSPNLLTGPNLMQVIHRRFRNLASKTKELKAAIAPEAKSFLMSLDGTTSAAAYLSFPDRFRDLFDAVQDPQLSIRGAGLSYAALSFSEGSRVVNFTRFNRILSFDPAAKSVVVEAGISLGKLYDFLYRLGYYLPVMAGHPAITVGGSMACNVHGKNPFREGVFASCVRSFELYHPAKGIIAVEGGDLFGATIGGYGLTGLILTATLAVEAIPGNSIRLNYVPLASLEETIEQIDRLKQDAAVIYSWNDLSLYGGCHGGGFLVCGSWENTEDGANSAQTKLGCQERGRMPWNTVRMDQKITPRRWGPSVIGPICSKVINIAYKASHRAAEGGTLTDPYFAFFPIASRSGYYSLYGKTGLLEQQVLVPETALRDYIVALRQLIARQRPQITLCSIKPFCGSQQFLQFSGHGYSVALDLPATKNSYGFLTALDEVNCAHGAITNICKDSRLSAQVLAKQYPQLDQFRAAVRAYDADRRFVSEMSKRLAL